MSESDPFDELLARCATEPIHIPGKIQPGGTLIALNAEGDRILYAAANAGAYLNREADELLGSDPIDLFGRELWSRVRSAREEGRPGRGVADPDGRDDALWVGISDRSSRLILEIERDRPRRDDPESIPDRQEELLSCSGREEILDAGVRHVRSITGYEHVMAYRFRANWEGEVVAEVTGDELPAYLGHRFPATDIPEQARSLYLSDRFRIIPDAQYEPVPILGLPEEPLDLSGTLLRSVSPVHLKYLENMGVRASCSISLVVEGRLWGLIACHHPRPAALPRATRRTARLYGRHLSAHLELALKTNRQEYLSAHREVIRLPTRVIAEERALHEHVKTHEQDVLDLVDASGWVLETLGDRATAGAVPAEEELDDLLEWLAEQSFDELWSTRYLAGQYPRGGRIAGTASGVLAARLSGSGPQLMVWFRPEVVREVTWAGDPEKPVEPEGNGKRLSPRSSFESWTEQERRHAERWRARELEAARQFRAHLIEAQVAELDRRKNRQLDVVHRMLRHDIRNKAGIVRGYADMLVGQVDETIRTDYPKLEQYLDRIDRVSREIVELTRSAYALSEAIHQTGALTGHPVDLNRMLARSVDEVGTQFPRADVRLELPDEGRAVYVLGGSLLDSVFRNLIENACVHHRGDAPEVVVEVVRTEAAVHVRVSDDGPGIPDGVREGLFEPARKGSESAGTGMGLFLVRLITEAYGGGVSVEENEPRGTTFVVKLRPTDERPEGG